MTCHHFVFEHNGHSETGIRIDRVSNESTHCRQRLCEA